MSRYKELIEKVDVSKHYYSPQYGLRMVLTSRLSREDFKNWEEDRAAALAWLKKSKPRRIFTLAEKALTMIPCYYGRSQFGVYWKGDLFSNMIERSQVTFDAIEEIRKYCKLNIWQTYWLLCFIFEMLEHGTFDYDYILFFNHRQMVEIVAAMNELANEIFN